MSVTSVPPVELQDVVRHYEIGELLNARRAESGFTNQNWVLETTRGRYFLKCRHPGLRDPHVIGAQHALVDHLRSQGFPAPALVPTAQGLRLLDLDGELLEVQQYIEHSCFEHGRAQHLNAAASMLARYHRVVEAFESQVLDSLGGLYCPPVCSTNLALLVERWDLGGDSRSVEPVALLAEHAAGLERRFATHRELPHLVVHGDYYADNLLFDGDRIIGVVDYDKARTQARVAEVAEAAIYFASPRRGRMKRVVYPGTLEWEPLCSFLDAYLGENALSRSEAEALPDYMAAAWLMHSLRRLAETLDRPPWAREALEEALELADWAETNAVRISAAAVSGARAGLSSS